MKKRHANRNKDGKGREGKGRKEGKWWGGGAVDLTGKIGGTVLLTIHDDTSGHACLHSFWGRGGESRLFWKVVEKYVFFLLNKMYLYI